jgi:hypothetical protein
MPANRLERRSFPRPPLWLNLLLLIVAAGTFAFARYQRAAIDAKSAILFQPTPSSPAELNRIRDELARTDVSGAQLAREIDGRMMYIESLQGTQFYLSVDTQKRILQFRFGRDVVRECPIEVGATETIKGRNGKTWTFLPLKGAFTVVGKETDYDWSVPEWLYDLHGERPPAERRVVRNGLGRYVIVVTNNYVIHSPPPPDSPLQGPKPGSFMAPEEDLAAIWPRISKETRVYIF